MDLAHKFHDVTYEPTVHGSDDSSSAIALDFADRSRRTSQYLSAAGKELAEAAQDLVLAIGEGPLSRKSETARSGTRRRPRSSRACIVNGSRSPLPP
ncbi:hypothetical protein TPA0910_30500 [Streptomyces hygroscopicus subsp. sporocinereus]|uniref:Uncharacterized protein n=1 Tax=Streptomyces hygroscopicus TaxID=1912 RepID=A0ABQ3TZR2_STRHY|nr:hypothetical protein TPA0910_30500 [Streptomyces hygroscopicus]